MKKTVLCFLTVLAMLSVVIMNLIGSYTAKAESVLSGNGTKNDPYIITNADDLELLDIINTKNLYFKLGSDINLFGIMWTPIACFDGYFDGDGRTISNLMVNTSGTSGLFMAVSGTVTNLNITNTSVGGRDDVGVIAGICTGEITNCTVSGVLSGYNRVGGVVGTLDNGTVAKCKSSVGILCQESDIGGIAGYAVDSEIYECANFEIVKAEKYHVGGIVGSANGSIVKNCYNISRVTGQDEVGGIVGELNENNNGKSVIEHCYNIGQINGLRSVGSVVGDCGGYSEYKNCYYLVDCASDGNSVYQNAQGNDTEGGSTPDPISGMALDTADFKILNNLKGFDTSIWKNGSNSPELRCFDAVMQEIPEVSESLEESSTASSPEYEESVTESKPESRPFEDSSAEDSSYPSVSTEETQPDDEESGILVPVLILIGVQAVVAVIILIVILSKRKQ